MPDASPVHEYPVGALDHFFLNDDTDECPAHFFVRATFDGAFNHRLFEKALDRALERHPLMRCVLDGRPTRPRRALRFVAREAKPFVRWARIGDPYTHPNGRVRIDIAREYGFRIFVHEDKARSVLVLQLHHAVVDGTGAMWFLEDILAFYEHLESSGPGAPRLRPLNPGKLHERDAFHQTPESLRARRALDISEGLRLATMLPHPLFGGSRRMKAGPMPAPTAVCHEFDREGLGRLRTRARAWGGTLNDFLVWNLLRTVAAWNRRYEPAKVPNLRLGIPVNMRLPEDGDVPACNLFSMYFMDRDGAQIDAAAALYAGVIEEMARVKSQSLGLVFAHVARVLGGVPFGLAGLIARKPFAYNCVDTVNLSNLGLALNASPMMREDGKLRAGSLTLSRFELLPPTRHMTHGSFGVASYDGRMAVTLHYDPRFFEESTAAELLTAYVGQLSDAAARDAL